MPAPTQVPPFLASVLGGQVDDVTTQGYLVNPEARSSTIGADSRQRSEQEIYNDGDLDLITASRSQPILLAPAVSSATSFDLASTLPSPLPTLLVPPLNFDMVCASRTSNGGTLYRSGFPNERNYPFLNTLQLRTVVYLSSDDVRPNLQQWIDSSRGRTRLLHFRLSVNKEPFAEMDVHVVADALRAILDRRNLPMLMHCNKGKYRVGVITALIRRLQGWSMTSLYDEYARFAGSDRIADEEFIDMFPLASVRHEHHNAPDWLPS